MGAITNYEKITELTSTNVFILDGENGTKAIYAGDLAKALISLLSSSDFISGVTLSDLTQVSELASGNKILVGTTDGNIAMDASDVLFAVLDSFGDSKVHRRVFRGKKLGTALTSTQLANIQDNTFKGMFLGDYWTIGSVNWRIWDMNYWYNAGDTAFTKPHLVIMPDTVLYNAQMNDSNTTEGGYVGTDMYTSNFATAKTLISSAFGDAVLTHREYLTNAVSNGYPSGGAWYDSTAELPNEFMMYGAPCFLPAGDGSFVPNRYTIDKKQLALAAIAPEYVNIRENYWLRDVVSSAYFAFVDYFGLANYYGASTSCGVRPVFPVG